MTSAYAPLQPWLRKNKQRLTFATLAEAQPIQDAQISKQVGSTMQIYASV